jgi:hypothetical protein
VALVRGPRCQKDNHNGRVKDEAEQIYPNMEYGKEQGQNEQRDRENCVVIAARIEHKALSHFFTKERAW